MSDETGPLREETFDLSGERQEESVEGTPVLIGPYRLLQPMGQGGMGSVYLAARADREFTKHVALKVIRKGMGSDEIVTRFRKERQILAALEHPNVARLLDGGTTEDGLPYFVMEYIQGRRLTEYCDALKLATSERLKLFQSVCAAVQYAHQNLIVHRDLKPANILVTADGTVKLLDFGIAKLLDPDAFDVESPETATNVRAMTPEYASPEQVKGDPITTATDVYSLGVILYELLSGERLYRFETRSHMEIYRKVVEEEPEKPSTVILKKQDVETAEKIRRELRGDMDNIVLRALRKEPQQRYPSAEALSQDIQRFLDGQPVLARKGTWSYRTAKYIKRNKYAVTAALAAVLVLIGFSAVTMVQNVRISEQRDAAEREKRKAELEKQKAEKVTQFLVDSFNVNDPAEAKGNKLTADQILARGSKRIRDELKDQPEVQAKLFDTVGNIYLDLHEYDQAKDSLVSALEIRKRLHGEVDPEVAQSMSDLGTLLVGQGKYDEAEKLERDALAIRYKLYGKEHVEIASSLNHIAIILNEKGQLAEAEKLDREALAMKKKLLGEEDVFVSAAMNNLAVVLQSEGKLEDALSLFRQSYAIDLKVLGSEHPQVTDDMNNLARLLRDMGQLPEAEKMLRDALAVNRKLFFGSENSDVAIVISNLGSVLEDQGKFAEAEKMYREALAIDRKKLGEEHPDVSAIMNNLAGVLWEQDSLDEAEALYRKGLALDRKILGAEHPNIATDMNNLAFVLEDKGETREPEKLHRDAVAMARKIAGNENPRTAHAIVGLAEFLLLKGEQDEATSLLNEVLAIPRSQLPEDSKIRARARCSLGAVLVQKKKYAEAEPLLVEAYNILAAQQKGGKRSKIALRRVIELYQAWGKADKVAEFSKKRA